MTIYTYKNCDTCRKALRWLDGKNIAHEVKAIRETPPTVSELEMALKVLGGNLRSLFNTSGNDYRELGMKDRLPLMNSGEAIDLLSSNGNLVKRPFLIGDGKVMVGFNEIAWQQTLD